MALGSKSILSTFLDKIFLKVSQNVLYLMSKKKDEQVSSNKVILALVFNITEKEILQKLRIKMYLIIVNTVDRAVKPNQSL